MVIGPEPNTEGSGERYSLLKTNRLIRQYKVNAIPGLGLLTVLDIWKHTYNLDEKRDIDRFPI